MIHKTLPEAQLNWAKVLVKLMVSTRELHSAISQWKESMVKEPIVYGFIKLNEILRYIFWRNSQVIIATYNHSSSELEKKDLRLLKNPRLF